MAKVSRQRYQPSTKSARNAIYESALDKLIGKFVSASRHAKFLWFESSKARISPRKNSVRFDNVKILQIQYDRMELQSPAASSFPQTTFTIPSAILFQRVDGKNTWAQT
jgi:hypothetical protein